MSLYENSANSNSNQIFKQKYFCQMCNRQCRDKDGFNCHLKTETHKRNVEIVSRNPEEFINKYSYEFESGFLDILKRTHPDVFVSANKIYQEYISDKFSTHLNATKWSSLTGFLKHLEAKGKCELIVTDKEIKIRYIDLSPESLRERNEKEKKVKAELNEEKRRNYEMKKILEKAENVKIEKNILKSIDIKDKKNDNAVNPEDLKNISITFDKVKTVSEKFKPHNIFSNYGNLKNKSEKNDSLNEKNKEIDMDNDIECRLLENKRKNDSEHEIRINDINKHRLISRSHQLIEEVDEIDFENIPWLTQGLIVRIKDKQLNDGKFFHKKAIVLNLDPNNEYIAEVELIPDTSSSIKTKLKIDQAFLEPVIPKENTPIKILFGKHKNKLGQLKQIKLSNKSCNITLNTKESIKLSLNSICKYNTQ